MWFVGLDAHLRSSSFHVLDENGRKVTAKTVKGGWQKTVEELKRLEKPFSICFEASNGYGHLFEKLSEIASHVAVAHPGQLRLIFRSKRKTDRVDAEKLAKLLYLDEVPPVYVPSRNTRDWRGMIEHRHKMVGESTGLKNQMKALLRGNGIEYPTRIWTGRGYKWLKSVEFESEVVSMRKDMLLERLEYLKQMIKRADRVLKKIASKHTGVNLLMTIPGVGIRTAEAVVAYIDNLARFSRSCKVGRYFGIVPSQDASAGVNRMGRITKEGPSTVRKMLVEAAWQSVRKSKNFREFYQRILKGDPDRKKIAIVATAHRLLRIMLAMLKTGELWRADAA